MLDVDKILEAVTKLLHLIYGNDIPPLVFRVLASLLLLAIFLWFIQQFVIIIANTIDVIRTKLLPLLYDSELRRQIILRQQFAAHLVREIDRLNSKEDWLDQKYTDLEAEVEAEGQHQKSFLLPVFHRTVTWTRREPSLEAALRTTSERLIILEGDPGSGKSVALRHLTLRIATTAVKLRRNDCVLPIYINLKELQRKAEEPIDRVLIELHVKATINRVNDRHVDDYVDNNFSAGMRDGIWLFLFDSFDEIPELLSSTDADPLIDKYSAALMDFSGGMNQCRSIIASRHFRGPDAYGWPRYRIQPLTPKRTAQLIDRMNLTHGLEQRLREYLSTESTDVQALATNPMFLALLCDYVRETKSIPQSAHEIYETYVTKRLSRDATRLMYRFKVSAREVRQFAESVAFCMAAEQGLGLEASRVNLCEYMRRQGHIPPANWADLFDALEYTKLGRGDDDQLGRRLFTFAHRRFQEYFATRVVLRHPFRVSAETLLTNGRWRETIVVLFQTQPESGLANYFEEIRRILDNYERTSPWAAVDPDNIVKTQPLTLSFGPLYTTSFPWFAEWLHLIRRDFERIIPWLKKSNEYEQAEDDFTAGLDSGVTQGMLLEWSPGLPHVLEIIQDGFRGRYGSVPSDIRLSASKFLVGAMISGSLIDKKTFLETAGAGLENSFAYSLRLAYASGSRWLQDVAYKQTARLRDIPSDLAEAIRQSLRLMFAEGSIGKDVDSIRALINQFDQPKRFGRVLNLYEWLAFIDNLCIVIWIIIGLYVIGIHDLFYWAILGLLLLFSSDLGMSMIRFAMSEARTAMGQSRLDTSLRWTDSDGRRQSRMYAIGMLVFFAVFFIRWLLSLRRTAVLKRERLDKSLSFLQRIGSCFGACGQTN